MLSRNYFVHQSIFLEHSTPRQHGQHEVNCQPYLNFCAITIVEWKKKKCYIKEKCFMNTS